MRRFLINSISFTIFTILMYLVFTVFFGTYLTWYSKNLPYHLESNMAKRMKEVVKLKGVDLLILGSSHAYRGYDVRIFQKEGYNTFNFGTSSQTPQQTEFLFTKYYNNVKPKFVIIDVYPFLYGKDGIESTTNIISNTKFDSDIAKLALNTKNIEVYNTTIFSVYKQLRGELKTFAKKDDEVKSDHYIAGGYVETYKTSKLPKKYDKSQYEILPQQLQSFANVIATLKTNKIPFIIIQAPIYQGRYKAITNMPYVDKIFKKFGPYYNFNELMLIPDKGFKDDSHMNQIGVNLFNHRILEIVNTIYPRNIPVNKNLTTF
jgi:hypothetical protein